jgi:serine/threonine-protein kinase RsbW
LELVDADGFAVKVNSARNIVTDHVRSYARLAHGESRARVVGDLVAANIRRAPQLMGAAYRRDSRLDLKGLIQAFRGKAVATALLDYGRFKAEFKGREDADIIEQLADSEDRTRLSRISYCADAKYFSTEFAEFADDMNVVIGLGIDSDMNDVAIIAAEIESKLEATKAVADVWHGRLVSAAHNCGFENYRIWLVASEGFDEAALKSLADQDAIGSSRKQALLLATSLDVPITKKPPVEEYELTVPMSGDSEIVSSRVVDEIGQKHGIPSKAINQIKTALVEACINAAEHGLSPDRKIYQRFAIENGALVITVSNRGIRLLDRKIASDEPEGGRRGWGLKLMRGLMDDVRIEDTDDGTRVTLIKQLNSSS